MEKLIQRSKQFVVRGKLELHEAGDMGAKGGLFRYADDIDRLLLFFGTLGSIGDGLMTPFTMYVLSGVIDELGTSDISLSKEIVDKVFQSGIAVTYI